MKKTFEQILLEGQAPKCETEEELFLLWQLMQQMEEEPAGTTGYADIDRRNFHIDGKISEEEYNGTLYILKETNMRKHIRRGQSFPVISDVRRDFRRLRSPSGEVEHIRYLAGMERILCGDLKAGAGELLRKTAVMYLNKRGGKGAADEISMQYGQYYIEFVKRQIQLLEPRTIVCCGEEIFRLVVMEVFHNKRRKKNQEEYMRWKNVVDGEVFYGDSRWRPAADGKRAAVCVINMWNPAYRVNNGQYVSLEEYLKEFERRVKKHEKNS